MGYAVLDVIYFDAHALPFSRDRVWRPHEMAHKKITKRHRSYTERVDKEGQLQSNYPRLHSQTWILNVMQLAAAVHRYAAAHCCWAQGGDALGGASPALQSQRPIRR